MRDAARAGDEHTNRASIRRRGSATTQRFDRDRSRGEPTQRFSRDTRAEARDGAAADAFQGENGPVHKRQSIDQGRPSGNRRFPPKLHSFLCLRANAPVQLRAVGPTGVELVAISISIQALNRNDFLESRARQLQRVLARVL